MRSKDYRRFLTATTCWLLCIALCSVSPALEAQDSTSRATFSGLWVARNFRPSHDLPFLTFVMDLRQDGEHVRGQIRWEQAGAFSTTGAYTALSGVLVGDSLVLHDERGAPILDGRIQGKRYTARIALAASRVGGPMFLTKLGPEAKSIRFERQ